MVRLIARRRGIGQIDLTSRRDPYVRRSHIAMPETCRGPVHLLECFEHWLHKPNRSIGVDLRLRRSRTNLVERWPRNMVEDDETPERRGKHIDNCGNAG